MTERQIAILPDWPVIEPGGESLGIQDFLTFKLTVVLNVVNAKVTKRYFDSSVPITLPAWRILGLLDLHGALSAKSLHEMSQMDKAQITRGLSELVAKDLASRTPADNHPTRKILKLTPAGKQLYLEVLRKAQPLHAEILLAMSEEERKIFNTCLGKILRSAAGLGFS